MFEVSDLPKLIHPNDAHPIFFWPLARPCVTHHVSEEPRECDVGLLNCALGLKTAFSKVLHFFKASVDHIGGFLHMGLKTLGQTQHNGI